VFPVLSFLGGPRRFGSERAGGLLEADDGDPRTIPFDYMSWTELDAWVEAGNEVGGHTLTHPFLSRLDRAEAGREVRGCREVLAARYRRPPELFCYPFGDDGGPGGTSVREAGFTAAVTSRAGVMRRGMDLLHLPRLPMPPSAGRAYDDLLFGIFRWRRALRRTPDGAGA
jgi:peptidoglycan/xylan/chitin deacetylase (PgdA/CDA1 family)